MLCSYNGDIWTNHSFISDIYAAVIHKTHIEINRYISSKVNIMKTKIGRYRRKNI